MLKRITRPTILAKATQSRPKINRLYYIVDLSRFNVELYQTLDGVFNAITEGLTGVRLDVNYYGLSLKVRYGKPILVNNRFLIGKTEHLYQRLLKRDKINSATMPATTTITSNPTTELPTILKRPDDYSI